MLWKETEIGFPGEASCGPAPSVLCGCSVRRVEPSFCQGRWHTIVGAGTSFAIRHPGLNSPALFPSKFFNIPSLSSPIYKMGSHCPPESLLGRNPEHPSSLWSQYCLCHKGAGECSFIQSPQNFNECVHMNFFKKI